MAAKGRRGGGVNHSAHSFEGIWTQGLGLLYQRNVLTILTILSLD